MRASKCTPTGLSTLNNLRDVLVMSIACGDAVLEQKLGQQFNTVSCFHGDKCSVPELAYLYVQRDLIDLALMFSRNQVDLANSTFRSEATSVYDNEEWRYSKAQRTAQSTGCSWSEATASQNFRRDSEEKAESSSLKNGFSVGTSFSYMYDRGTRFGGGNATSYSDSQSRSRDYDQGITTFCSKGNGFTQTQTSPQEPIGFLAPTVILSTTWPYITTSIPDTEAVVPKHDAFNCFGEIVFDMEGPNTYICNHIPSAARSWQVTGDAAISFGIGGVYSITLRVGLRISRGNRNSYMCSIACQHAKSNTYNVQQGYSATIAAGLGHTDSQESSTIINNAFQESEGTKHGETHVGEASASDSLATAESHSRSQRQSHGENQGSSQGTSEGKRHFSGVGLDEGKNTGFSEKRYWSQIFEQLNKMWTSIQSQIEALENIRIGSQKPKIAPIRTPVGKRCCIGPQRHMQKRVGTNCFA